MDPASITAIFQMINLASPFAVSIFQMVKGAGGTGVTVDVFLKLDATAQNYAANLAEIASEKAKLKEKMAGG